jgi:hypothetical protein
MARTKTVSVSSAAAPPSFLVYPIPSIADESFLQLIFRRSVARSLFFGFGRSRMAIAELTSADVAEKVLKALQSGTAASEAGPAQPTTRGTLKASKAKTQPQEQVDDATNVEDMTLADMFAPPTAKHRDGPNDGNDDDDDDVTAANNAAAGTGTALSDTSDFSHLSFLVFRGRPVHVVVSGVRVADFDASGGTVPQKHENQEDRSSTKKKLKKERGVVAQRPSLTTSAPAPAPAAAAAKYSNDCCRKCGSRDHLTRHCDGSGVQTTTARTASTEAAAPTAAETSPLKRPRVEEAEASVAVAAPPAQVKPQVVIHRTSKDQCKYCGSDAHLSRHCPNR